MTQEAPAQPVAFVAHQLPGRVRLKLPSHQGNTTFFAALAERLRDHAGIQKLRTNPPAASLLVEHTLPLAKVRALVEQSILFLKMIPLPELSTGLRHPASIRCPSPP